MPLGGSLAGTAKVVLQADTAQFQRDLSESQRQFHHATGQMTEDVEKASRGALAGSGAFHSLGRSIAFASASFLGAAGFVSVVRSSISAASDLNEEVNKAAVVFSGSQREILNWSTTTAKALGISRAEALQMASTFGNMLVPMGFARDRAAEMSKGLVNLAADMASFNNADPSQVLQAIQSGIAGQVRPLREYGVFLDQARIKAEAMTSGLVHSSVDLGKVRDAQEKLSLATFHYRQELEKHGASSAQAAKALIAVHTAQSGLEKAVAGSTATLTAAQKAAATYAIILKDTHDAQGDFARTSGGLANQQRILHAQLTNLEEVIGKALLPTVLQIVGTFNKWLDRIEKNKAAQQQLKNIVDDVVGSVKTLAGWVQKAADLMGGWEDSFKFIVAGGVALKLASMVGLFQGITASIRVTEVAQGGLWASMKVGAISTAATMKAALVSTGIGIIVVAIGLAVEQIIEHWSTVKRWLQDFGSWIKSHAALLFALPVIGQFAFAAVEIIKHWQTVKGWFVGFWNWLKRTALETAAAVVEPFSHIPGQMGDWARKAKASIKKELWDMEVEDARRSGREAAAAFEKEVEAVFGTIAQQEAALRQPGKGDFPGTYSVEQSGAGSKASPQSGSVVAKAQQLGVGSGGVYVTGGGHGGVAKPGSVFDCSGYVYQVFTQSGFENFPGVSETQWSQMEGSNWTSERVSANEAQPGDVVFMVGSPKYASPGHVGIVTSGFGMGAEVMSYYSSGKPAHVVPLREIGDLVGLKRFLLVQKSGSSGGSTRTGGASASTPSGHGYTDTATPKTKDQPTIPKRLQEKLARAELTKSQDDDLATLNEIERYLEEKLKHEKNIDKRIEILNEIHNVRDQKQQIQDERRRKADERKRKAQAEEKKRADALAKAQREQAKKELHDIDEISNLEKAKIDRLSAGGTDTVNVYGGVDPAAEAEATQRVAIAEGKLAAARRKYGANTTQVAEATLELQKAQKHLQDVEKNKTVVGKAYAGQQEVVFDPKTGKYIVTVVKPDVEALKAELKHILEVVLPKLDNEIKTVRAAIARLAPHPKKNKAQLARLRAKLAALIKERAELIALAKDLAISIKELSDAIAMDPEPEDVPTGDIPEVPVGETGGGSGGDGGGSSSVSSQPPGLSEAEVQAKVAAEQLGFLTGLRQLREFQSDIYSPFAGLNGSQITVQNFYTQQPKDPHSWSKNLEFELRAIVG